MPSNIGPGAGGDQSWTISAYNVSRVRVGAIQTFCKYDTLGSHARNIGKVLRGGSLLAYLDDDNLWYPAVLAAVVPFAARNEVDCAYGANDYGCPLGGILFAPC